MQKAAECNRSKNGDRLRLGSSQQAPSNWFNVLPSKSVSTSVDLSMGDGDNKNSIPPRSHLSQAFKLFYQRSQRFGNLVTAIPPEQLGRENTQFEFVPIGYMWLAEYGQSRHVFSSGRNQSLQAHPPRGLVPPPCNAISVLGHAVTHDRKWKLVLFFLSFYNLAPHSCVTFFCCF